MDDIKLVEVKRRTVTSFKPREERRRFLFPLKDMKEMSVCRLTFLDTLGYTNDSVITELVRALKRAPGGSLVKEYRGIHPKRKVKYKYT